MSFSLLNNMFSGDSTQSPVPRQASMNPQNPPPAVGNNPFSISQGGYGGGSLSSLGVNPAQYQTNNNYGLEDYIDPNKTAATIGGRQYRIQADPSQGQLKLYDPNNEQAGGYLYDSKGNFQNWAPYMATPSWASDVGQFAVTAAGMGAGLGAMGFTDGLGYSAGMAGSGLGATSGVGGFAGDATAAGYGGLDAASTATMGGGASLPFGGAGAAAGGAGGLAGAAGGAGGGGGAGAASSGLTGNPILDKVIGTGASTGLSAVLGGGKAGSGSGLGGLASGAYDYYAQNKAANNMLDYMKTQQGKIDNIYNNPNSPVAKTMWDQMSAADARAGRNSQYGTRTTDFLGKFGGDYAKYTAALTQGLAGNYQQAYNQQASAGTGLATGIGKALGNVDLNSIIQNGSSYIPTGTSGAYTAGGQVYNNPTAYGGSTPYEEDTNVYNPTIY